MSYASLFLNLYLQSVVAALLIQEVVKQLP